MKIVLAFNGTRGDIQPAVVLGLELQRRGHDVVLGVPPNLCEFVARAGLDVRPFGYDTKAHMNSDLVRRRVREGGLLQRLAAIKEVWNFGWDQMVGELIILARDADVLVTGLTTQQIAFNVAEHNSIPLVALHHAPVRKNTTMSPIFGASLDLPGVFNRVCWTMFDHIFWLLTKGRENRMRADLGLAAATAAVPERMDAYGAVEIQAYDEVLCPELAREWAEHRPFTGFLSLDQETRKLIGEDLEEDPGLLDWINRGTAPVYFGFGSMPVTDPAGILAAITEACSELGVRGIVSAGWNDFGALSQNPNLAIVGPVDHERIFPLCRAVVHHGGAGTTSAGVRAGRPSLICWVSSDQPFWGAQLRRRGVGASLPFARLSAATLVQSLGEILDASYIAKSATLSELLTSPTQAVERAASVVERAALAFAEQDHAAQAH